MKFLNIRQILKYKKLNIKEITKKETVIKLQKLDMYVPSFATYIHNILP